MKRRHLVLGIAVLTAAGLAWAARTAWRGGPGTPDGPFAPTLDRGEVVSVADYRFSGPYTHDNLAVYLVHGADTLAGASFVTLQEALAAKTAVVHETGSVNRLAVENLSAGDELFVQSGDIVKGGKQDRTLPYDAVIGPGSGQVPVDSFCVEQGRWSKRGSEESSSFSSSSSGLSTLDLKRAAKAPEEASQAEMWRSVGRTQERLGKKLGQSVKAGESASSLQLTLESPALRTAVAPYLAALMSAPDGRSDAIGYVAVVDGKVVSADVYASAALFRKVWPKLLEGSAVEAFIEAEPGRYVEPPGVEAVRAVLTAAEGAPACGEAVTERTYVQVRRFEGAWLFDSCDRSRGNLVIHRSVLAR